MTSSPPSLPARSLSQTGPSSSMGPSSLSSRNNPISLRIYKAIGTTFDDPESREALEIVSSFYAPSTSNTTKGKGKAQEDQDIFGSHDPSALTNGDGEEDIFSRRRTLKGQSAAMARRHLKRGVERKLADGSHKFLNAFGEVDKKLSVLREHMQEMQIRCDQVQAELDQANSGTKYLLERADGLRSQRASAQLRSQIVDLFLKRFTLSEVESRSLTSREVPVGPALFESLERVERIRFDCQALLAGEEGTVQAGMDIMKATSEQMELGYKKLHRWCQFEFRQFTKEAQLEVSPLLREALQKLKQRPALLDDVCQILISTRQSSVLNAFIEALTRGGPNGLPRPIELHAHDPTRYVGDMLAWVHQATASEHEFLSSLFGLKEKNRMIGSRRDEEKEEDETMVAEILDKDLEGLGRPLKMRIQQTIKSQEGLIMTYKITNLVQFYLVTMRKTIGQDAGLTETLQQIYAEAYATFFEALEAQGRSMLRFLHAPDSTLSPPLALRDSTQILREIISVYDRSLVDESDRLNDEDFAKMLEKAVDPAVEMCEKMADMRKGSGGDWERDIFMINCLGYLQHTLEIYPFTQARVRLLEEQIQRHVESMTYEHHGKLLEQSGLGPIMKTIRTRPADTPLARVPATSSKALTSALAQFSQFLTSLDVLTTPRLALLSSSKLAEKVHRSALRRISQAYAEVCDRVLDKKEGYEFGETLLRRGRDEVAVALGVDGDEREDEHEGDYGNGNGNDIVDGEVEAGLESVTNDSATEQIDGAGEAPASNSNGDRQP